MNEEKQKSEYQKNFNYETDYFENHKNAQTAKLIDLKYLALPNQEILEMKFLG